MAKRRRSLAGPCMLEVLPKSGHQPWKASGMADFGQRALSPLGNILGMHIPFFFLATACFFLMAISSIAELLWDTSQENKLGKLRQVATMHLGLDFVISPERLARPIQPCFAGEEDEHPEMHPDPGRDLSPFPPGDISSRVSSAAHIKEGKSLYNPGFRASACRITSLGKLMEEKRCSPGFLDCQLLHLLTDAKIPAFPHVVVLNNQVSASKSMLERI
nr:uncharacterized protein LOC110355089 isoform X2 [Columba livia]XP_021135940.1 uncharacterized protein LOC110355089 isoform X2 [Columba livia]